MKSLLGISAILVVSLSFYVFLQKSPESVVTTAKIEEGKVVDLDKVIVSEAVAQIHDDVSLRLRFDQTQALLANDPTGPAQLSEAALLLDDPNTPEPKVKEAVHSLLSTVKYFSKNKSFPAGLNVEVTNALLGKNDRKFAYLSQESLRINQFGELIDDFGSPYWFHEFGTKDISITSAGPDRILHTDDDITFPAD